MKNLADTGLQLPKVQRVAGSASSPATLQGGQATNDGGQIQDAEDVKSPGVKPFTGCEWPHCATPPSCFESVHDYHSPNNIQMGCQLMISENQSYA